MIKSAPALPALGFAFATWLALWPAPSAHAQEPALAELRAAAARAPADVDAQLALGHALIRAGHLDAARGAMQRAVQASHGKIEVLYEAARVPLAEADSKRARSACQALEHKDRKHVLTHVCNARAFLVWRRSSRALEHVQAALAVAPNDAEALLALADLQRTQGDLEAARKSYERAAAAAPQNPAPQLGLGLTLDAMKQPEPARAALREALRLDPTDPQLQFELGQRSDGARAIVLLRSAVTGRPDWPAAKLELARAQLRSGDADSAERALQALLRHDGNNAAARAEHGAALLQLNRPREAELELRKAVELVPNDYDASFTLARLYERTGRPDDAFSQYRYTADIRRDSIHPLLAAAELGLNLKRPVLAAAMLDRALERSPKSAKALALYGDTLAARAQPAAAREYYRRALQAEGPLDRAAVEKQLTALK